MPTTVRSAPARFAAASMIILAALLPRLACATLGEPEMSAQDDSRRLQGSIKSTDRSLYRIHEIDLPSGTVVREFAALDGDVFAVAWRGPAVPNLQQMLGKYFDSFVTAARLTHGDHHHLRIEGTDLVVHAGGHMRAFSGQAYLPGAVPAGVTRGELR